MMEDQQRLIYIKVFHTAIWLFFNVVLVYLYYAAITNQINLLFWLGIGAFVMELIVLLIYQWSCPLTLVARKYSDSKEDNFDIYLPNWLARHNKTIYSILLGILIIIFIYKQLHI